MMFSHRLIQFLCVASAAAGFFVHEKDITKDMDPSCPTVNHYTAEYHMDGVCNRAAQNTYKDSLNRAGIQRRLMVEGTDRVPSQKTSFCPQTVTPLTNSEASTGFDTVWIVENTASTPIVLAFMLEQPDGTYKEVSAFDSKISPPNHDPKAIVMPEKWTSLHTYEGHVFHAREILKDGSMGQVLMQHRVGLIPVTNKYGHELQCDPNDPDPEPLVEVSPGQVDRDPNFAREAPRTMRPCNTLDIGFRNEVGCPLNAYYTGMYQLKGSVKPRGNNLPIKHTTENATTAVEENPTTPKSCHEVFKFHLGLQEKTNNFMFDWNSKTKYEGTFVGHNFVFRLAKDERIVVDSIALQPTKIIDCPGLKNQVAVGGVSEAEAIITPLMQPEHDMMLSNMMLKNLNATAMNATEWAQQPQQQQVESPSAARRRRRAQSANRGASVLMQSF